jgi:uncharacterized protein with GYD domain
MAKYLLRISYTLDGVRGVLKEGGTARVEAATKAASGLGGTIDDFYFAFGDDDAIVIADFPDTVTAAALSMAVAAGGGVRLSTTPLITPAEMDAAVKLHPDYRPPGA